MKLYFWEEPYPVAWGNSFVCVLATNLREAKKLAVAECKKKHYAPGNLVLGKPTSVYKRPNAIALEWSE